jgi:hypothetical protein
MCKIPCEKFAAGLWRPLLMYKFKNASVAASFTSTPLAILLLIALIAGTSGCVKKTVGVPPLLTPLADAKIGQLQAEVNRLASVRSIRGKVDIQFQDTSFAESGISEKYRTADGTVTLQRPNQIYLTIQTPFVAKDLAEMTSDGEHFRVAVLTPFPGGEKYRSFLRGTNSAVYGMPDMDGRKTSGGDGKNRALNEERAVSVLANVRPQHFTDALLINPIQTGGDSRFIYAQSEFYQEEHDTRPKAGKGARVMRGYYLLDELIPGEANAARLVRRFWFNRVDAIRLARLQTFNDTGVLETDVAFSEMKSFGEEGRVQLPSRIEVTRPQDHYKLSIAYQVPESVVLDREYKPQAFVLENSFGLREIDLDARQNKREASSQ